MYYFPFFTTFPFLVFSSIALHLTDDANIVKFNELITRSSLLRLRKQYPFPASLSISSETDAVRLFAYTAQKPSSVALDPEIYL